MEWQLRIECLSAVCPGSGLGHPGQVDRDIVLNSVGLPYIPGKRLKAMLSEAYQELALYKPGLTRSEVAPSRIFGATGDEKPGPLSVRSAEVAGAERIRAWLKHKENPVTRQDVIDSFTEVRRQTAMDRDSGAPLENTLRATRVLRKGLVLLAPIEGIETFEDAVRDAARALQSMGTGRTRGWGNVKCRLEQVESGRKETVAPACEREGRIGIHIRLADPAIFPILAGDPNTVFTDDCVPGSVVRGMLASRYVAKYKVAGERFYNLFFSDRVRFLSGHPRIGSKRIGSQAFQSAPIPACLRESKSVEGVYHDLTKSLPAEPVRRVRGWYQPSDGDACEHGQVATRLHYHNARAADQRIGRAVGEQYQNFEGLTDSQQGAFFTYEALCEGQEFDAEICGSEADLATLVDLVKSGERIRIGRSRNSEYGGVIWTWQQPKEAVPSPRADPSCTEIVVTLLSDLVGVNEHGHPAPEFPFSDLATALDVKFDIDKREAFVQTAWQAGYMAHQRLARQQTPALAAGSVFKIPLATPGAPNFQRALQRSYGLRVEEGFGQIALAATPTRLERPDEHVLTVTPPASPDSPEYWLACQVFRSQIERRAVNRALYLADKADEHQLGKISNSLLGRILLFLERPSLADTAAEIGALRKLAQDQLNRLWVSEKIGSQAEVFHLRGFLLDVCKSYLSIYSWIQDDQVYLKEINNWKRTFPNGAPDPPDGFPMKMVRLFLRQYVRALLWKKRKQNEPTATKPAEEANDGGTHK